ncbi:ABC transporter substrate-binding protein [Chelativorans salis]|uniref:ABC transporter substrate-binding protein n=1 Tax=Chelativorans salis TaxID=2978478 RepID=A0ABT2LXJ8_9HYPH|nr:ABC transporter substrate-binding protein [Chelativorans sp. EGI FJ00035]MCT7378108.1 ABC transporter substrate-binding protein [Chelativorans sp. EGI FJ00035]
MTTRDWSDRDGAMVAGLMQKGMGRRDVLRMLTAGGLAMTSAGAMLTHAGRAFAQTPVRGGSIRVAGITSSNADTLDPAKASNQTDYIRACAFYNRLTVLDNGGLPQMDLAESVDSADAKTWTIRLKSGVTFHDSKSLTSADVVYSLQRHLDETVGSKVNSIAKQMTTIRAVDDLTIEVGLDTANADLPTILALHHFMIVADGTTDFTKGNGTGPFICESFEPGVRAIGVRNPNYFKDGKPYLDSFEHFGIADNSARVNALLSGDVHLASSVKPQYLRLVENNPAIALVTTNAGNYTNLNVRLDLEPGMKAGFAEGLKHLLNRELIVNSILRGVGEIGNDQPIPSASFYYNHELPAKPFDPEKARFLFEKAGLLGQTIPIVASDAADASVEMATVLQQAGAEIGMKFEIQRVPSDGYWSNYWLKSPVHFGNINPRPTPDIYFSLLYASDAPWNESQYRSEAFDKLLLEARGLLDLERRKEIYHQMQVMIAGEAGTAIPARSGTIDAMTSKLKGFEANPLGGLMGYAFSEHVWLEA